MAQGKLRADVKVTADQVMSSQAQQYQEIIGRLVHENALLDAANETLANRASELEAENAALKAALSEPEPEPETASTSA